MMSKKILSTLLLSASLTACLETQLAPDLKERPSTEFKLDVLESGLANPWSVAELPDGSEIWIWGPIVPSSEEQKGTKLLRQRLGIVGTLRRLFCAKWLSFPPHGWKWYFRVQQARLGHIRLDVDASEILEPEGRCDGDHGVSKRPPKLPPRIAANRTEAAKEQLDRPERN